MIFFELSKKLRFRIWYHPNFPSPKRCLKTHRGVSSLATESRAKCSSSSGSRGELPSLITLWPGGVPRKDGRARRKIYTISRSDFCLRRKDGRKEGRMRAKTKKNDDGRQNFEISLALLVFPEEKF